MTFSRPRSRTRICALLAFVPSAAAMVLGATALPAEAAPPSAGCAGLTLAPVLPDSANVPTTLYAQLPDAFSLHASGSPEPAFTASQGGRVLAVTATAEPTAATDVALVLAADPTTSDADYLWARLAAHELLLDLPVGVRTALVTGSGPPRTVSGLSASPTPAAAALGRLVRPAGADSSAQAVELAAQQLRPGGHVVLLSGSTSSTQATDSDAAAAAGRALAARGLTLDRMDYALQAAPAGPGAGPLHGAACSVPDTTSWSLLHHVDDLVQRVSHQYELSLTGAGTGPISVRAQAAGLAATGTIGESAPTTPTAADRPGPREARPALVAPRTTAARRVLVGAIGGSAVALAIGALLLSVRRRRRVLSNPVPARVTGAAAPAPASGSVAVPGPAAPTGIQVHRGGGKYPDVDVAIVQESTYPYLKGGVSAVVHDIVKGNQDLTFGIIHITWDSNSPAEDLYGMPDNVKWVRPVYLSMQEHVEDFSALRPQDLGMSPAERAVLSQRVYDALDAVVQGDMDPMWALYDEGMNPRTRRYPFWALLGSEEFMVATRERLPGLGLPLVATFWLLREFFSLACAVVGGDFPRAAVYHAHTTGYASLLAAAAARQNGTSFLLTEHNLYVRDTVNFMLERSMALTLTADDWRTFDVPPTERAWMAWWIEMGRFCYPSAEAITYLYPKAITEAADLGAPVEKSVVIPNGMIVREFADVAEQRKRALPAIVADDPARVWRLVYIARVVPIKGLADLIGTVALLVERGITNFHLDILGPTDHHPAYYALCREKARTLRVEDYLTFRGTVNVRELLGEFDLLVLPSYNEGQPIVVLEAMTAGIPSVGTEVGGMAQLVDEPLTTPGGHTWGPAGLLVQPDYVVGMADALQTMMRDPEMYREFARNARGRVADFFQLEDAMGAYNRLYRELGGLPEVQLESAAADHTAGHTADRIIDLAAYERRDERPVAGYSGPARRSSDRPAPGR